MKKLNYQTIKGRCFKALIVLLLAPLSSWAQDLTVGGVEVTSGEYLISDNIEGLVSFDASTNTLTLENATITGGYMTNGCITSGLSHLTIYLIGENKICSTDSSTAIRSTANEASLTIVKGDDNCKLVFDALRCIRDFKTVSFDGLSWNGAYTYEYDNTEWDAGYRLMGADGYEATISYDTGVRPTLGDPVPTMSTYSGQSNETRLFMQNDFGLPMYYSIDYASKDLQDVSVTQYTGEPELLGPCTVTAYVKKSNGVNGTSVVGKYFGFVLSSVEALSGQYKPVKPELIPAFGSGEYEEFAIDFVSERQEDFEIASPDGMELYIVNPGTAQFEAHLYDYREEPTFTILNARVEDETQTDVYYQLGSFTVTVNDPTHYGIFLNGECEVTEANMQNVFDDEEVVRVIYDGNGTLILNGFEGSIQSTCTDDLTIFLKGQNYINSISAEGTAAAPGRLLITTDKQAPGTLDLGSQDATAAAIRNFSGVELLNDLCWIKGNADAAYAEVGVAITPVLLDENAETVVEPDNQNIEDLQTPPASIPDSEKVEVKENEGQPNETTTIIINKVVENVLVTLVVSEQEAGQPAETLTVAEKAGDPLTEGGGTAQRNAFVLQTVVGESDMNAALTKTPGTPDYAEVFHGVTLLVAAGSGTIELDVEVPATAVLNVQIGDSQVKSFSDVSGIISVRYVCKEPTYVYIYNATPQAAEARGHRRAKVKTVPVKLFGVKATTSSVQAAAAPEAAAKPEKRLTVDGLNTAIDGLTTTGGVLNFDDPELTTLPDDIFTGLSSTVTNIDLSKTSVKNVHVSRSASGPFKGVSRNTFIYLPAGNGNTAAEGEPNVVIGAVCDNMQLDESSHPFSPVMNFGVLSATLGRDFVAGRTSTVYLPFAVDQASADALGEFYTFAGITPAGDADLKPVTKGLAAKTPYIFKKSGAGKISVKNVSVTTDAAPASTELIGTFTPITWTSQMLNSKKNEHKYVYGFAAENQGVNIQAGEFVRVAAGATIKPYRAYLEVAYNASRIAINWGGDETTGIRTLQSVKPQAGWFTIGGSRLAGAPSKPGLYIFNGKKVIVNGK